MKFCKILTAMFFRTGNLRSIPPSYSTKVLKFRSFKQIILSLMSATRGTMQSGTLMTYGLFNETVKERMQGTLDLVIRWAENDDLKISPLQVEET